MGDVMVNEPFVIAEGGARRADTCGASSINVLRGASQRTGAEDLYIPAGRRIVASILQ